MRKLPILSDRSLALLFFGARIILFMALPLEGVRGYGDLLHFYRLAVMGVPFLDYWVEFPPLFPYLSMILARLAGANQHVYDYLLVLLLSAVQAASVVVFARISRQLWGDTQREDLFWLYFVVLLVLPYGWWYFDAIAVLAMMWGLMHFLASRDGRAVAGLTLGIMTKWFPALALGIIWRYRRAKRAFLMTVGIVGVVALLLVVIWSFSPDFTAASLRSQWAKGSWETIWALLDGNLHTGNFGPEIERQSPETAAIRRGNPALVPPQVTLVVFLLVGLWLFLRADTNGGRGITAFFGATWCLFLLWSPGFSPQWVLYLLPLILLTLEKRLAFGFSINLVAVALLEWPLLLSRGRFDLLWLPVIIRTLLLVVLCFSFSEIFFKGRTVHEVGDTA